MISSCKYKDDETSVNIDGCCCFESSGSDWSLPNTMATLENYASLVDNPSNLQRDWDKTDDYLGHEALTDAQGPHIRADPRTNCKCLHECERYAMR